MIYSLCGKLTHTGLNLAVVECGGVGYGCKTTSTTLSALPKMGGDAMLFTYLHITENALDLFGFATSLELDFFKKIISVSGVGPKVALALLSDLTPERLALCIAAGDYKTITRAPGVGNKIAQRIVLELKDKVSSSDLAGGFASADAADANTGSLGEAINALMSLGYARADAAAALSRMDASLGVEELIKAGLKALSSMKS